MKPLKLIYWIRVVLGVVAALITTLVIDLKVGDPLISGISIGIIFYIITYYILKWQFLNKVEKPPKIFTMGIGAYFLAFILCWTLFITPFLTPPTATFTMTPNENLEVGQSILFDASASIDPDGTIVKYVWYFGDDNKGTGETINHTYASAGDYIVTLRIKDNQGIGNGTEKTITVSPAP